MVYYIHLISKIILMQAKHAESLKVDSLLCLPELYFKPTTAEQLINYLRNVSYAAPNTPLLYYHIPMFTSVNSKYNVITVSKYKTSIPDQNIYQQKNIFFSTHGEVSRRNWRKNTNICWY